MARRRVRVEGGAAGEGFAAALEQVGDFLEAVLLTRDQEEAQGGVGGAGLLKEVEDVGFFGGLGAAGDQYQVIRLNAEQVAQRLGAGVMTIRCHTVVFDVAGNGDPIRGDAEGAKVGCILVGLHAQQIDATEDPAGDRGQPPPAPETARTHPAIDDRHRHAALPGRRQEIRPQFALGQDDQRRVKGRQGAGHGPGEVERVEEDGQVGEAAAGLVVAGVRRRGQDDGPPRMPLAEGRDDRPQ